MCFYDRFSRPPPFLMNNQILTTSVLIKSYILLPFLLLYLDDKDCLIWQLCDRDQTEDVKA
jgi:hypothetical protein